MAKARASAIEGTVRDLTHGGDSVVETEQGIVFARGALPGERVRLRITGRARGVARGTLLALLEPSPERRPAACPLAEACGGCPLMTWSEPLAAAWKAARVAHALAAAGTALEPALISGPNLRYRGRARLAWHAQGGAITLGYHAASSLRLVDVPACLVLRDELATGFARLRERLGSQLTGSGEIALGLGAGGGCVAELTSDQPQPPATYAAIEALVADAAFVGIALRIGREGARARFGDPRQCVSTDDGSSLWAPPGGFVQANVALNQRLVAEVVALAETRGARVLELYAGHGNFSVALARGARELCAVEADREAAEACADNLAARGFTHARASCQDAVQGAAGRGPLDVVVLDPPRAGAKALLPVLIARAPARIVYVSCDPTTLRRDLKTLVAAGYRVDAALAFDMFPQTSHVESVVRLRR